MIERGIVVGGVVQPGTGFVLRRADAWWKRGERGTTKRTQPTEILGGHWTGGRDHDGPEAVVKVVRNMKARRYPKGHKSAGQLMKVAAHFVIAGGHLEPGRALVWQTCDLAEVAYHGAVSGRSIGVEVISPGTAKCAALYGGTSRRELARVVDGDLLRCVAFWPSQLEAWLELAEALVRLDPSTGITIPRCVPVDRDGAPMMDRLTPKQIRSYRGALEHFHEDAHKADAAGMLMEPLAAAHWPGAMI